MLDELHVSMTYIGDKMKNMLNSLNTDYETIQLNLGNLLWVWLSFLVTDNIPIAFGTAMVYIPISRLLQPQYNPSKGTLRFLNAMCNKFFMNQVHHHGNLKTLFRLRLALPFINSPGSRFFPLNSWLKSTVKRNLRAVQKHFMIFVYDHILYEWSMCPISWIRPQISSSWWRLLLPRRSSSTLKPLGWSAIECTPPMAGNLSNRWDKVSMFNNLLEGFRYLVSHIPWPSVWFFGFISSDHGCQLIQVFVDECTDQFLPIWETARQLMIEWDR